MELDLSELEGGNLRHRKVDIGDTIAECAFVQESQKMVFTGPIHLAALQRKKLRPNITRKVVPLMEPDIGSNFGIEFIPQFILNILHTAIGSSSNFAERQRQIQQHQQQLQQQAIQQQQQQLQQQQLQQQQIVHQQHLAQQQQQQQQQLQQQNQQQLAPLELITTLPHTQQQHQQHQHVHQHQGLTYNASITAPVSINGNEDNSGHHRSSSTQLADGIAFTSGNESGSGGGHEDPSRMQQPPPTEVDSGGGGGELEYAMSYQQQLQSQQHQILHQQQIQLQHQHQHQHQLQSQQAQPALAGEHSFNRNDNGNGNVNGHTYHSEGSSEGGSATAANSQIYTQNSV